MIDGPGNAESRDSYYRKLGNRFDAIKDQENCSYRQGINSNCKTSSGHSSSLHGTLWPHNASSKELTNHSKPVFRSLELALEEIMLIGRFHLSLSNCFDRRVLRRTDRAFSIFVDIVQTALVEGMLAEEVDGWEVETTTARHAPACLEHNRFAS